MTARKGKSAAQKRQGTLIIIGGHEDHDGERVILKEVARRVANGRLVLATVASHSPEGTVRNIRRRSVSWASNT
jgi:cyanophycinase